MIFIGLKSCGKSTLGQVIADQLQRPFYDADSLMLELYCSGATQAAIKSKNRMEEPSLREVYIRIGKEAFDQLQLKSLSLFFDSRAENQEDYVLALGGGAADLSALGKVLPMGAYKILLSAPLSLLYRRMQVAGLPPYISSSARPFKSYVELAERRLQHYRALADIEIDCASTSTDADELSTRVLQEISKFEDQRQNSCWAEQANYARQ